MSVKLFKQNSAEDYVLRGFSQSEILDFTGVDVGYHGNALKASLKGIDRYAYKILYVQTTCSSDTILDTLDKYSKGLDKESVLRCLGIAGANIVKLKQLFSSLGYAEEFAAADKAQRKLHMKNGTIAKYGTDNVFKLSEFQEKAGDTREKRYGGRYTLSSDSSLAADARATFTEHMKDDAFRSDLDAKKKATNEERYGNTCVMNNPDIRAKHQETCIEKYGVDHPMKIDKNRLAFSLRLKEHADEYNKKSRETCMEKYGVPYYSQTDDFRQMMRDKALAEDSIGHMQEVMLLKHGVKYSHQIPAVREDFRQFFLNNLDSFLEKSRETCIERYGVPYFTQTDEFKRMQSKRMLDAKVQKQLCAVRLKNHTFKSSLPEDNLYELLCMCFDASDIERQYISEEYPYACDFYIKSRNLYIELNASWTHGCHWYDMRSNNDVRIVNEWRGKNTAYYDNAISTWTQRDVKKRCLAGIHNLNYVVFWDEKLSDAMLWIGMDCPDGQDWQREYSWLPERNLMADFSYPEIDACTNKSVIAAVKAANGHVFYANEIALWNKNPYVLRHGTLQARLYENRYKYLGKLPYELSDAEILRGLSIAGLYRGYSVFDNTGMVDLIKRYDVKSIYDPCAGWGERLLTSGLLGVKYQGCDINARLFDGYDSLINHYHLQDCQMHLGDSSMYDMRKHNHDCVFTCPPYESVEHYTTVGAENFSHEDFLKWWKEVVLYSVSDTTHVFAYQINTRFKDDMNQILLDLGWTLTEQIPVGKNAVSHLSKRNGKKEKKNWDEIQVFVRK